MASREIPSFDARALFSDLAIVGSSSTLLGSDLGPEIDQHIGVVRFNRAPTAGFETDVGTKTALRVLNWHTFNCIPSDPPNDDDMFASKLTDSTLCVFPWYYWFPTDLANYPLIHPSNTVYRLPPAILDPDNPCSPSLTSGLAFVQACVSAGIVPHLFGFDLGQTPSSRRHYWSSLDIPPSICHNYAGEAKALTALAAEGLIVLRGST